MLRLGYAQKRRWILIAFLIALLVFLGIRYRIMDENAAQRQIERENGTVEIGLIVIQNALMPISSIEFPYTQVLASKIVDCESGGNPTAKNPDSSAYGLCQFIDSTWLYVQEKWDMKLDRRNEDDQWYACKRLLEEEGAEKHWSESKNCWSQ